jgi:Zn-dependent peptidase ImmA (M78 family)
MREMSQGQLADCTKLQPSAVSHFETGSRKPSFDNLRRLADALSVTTDYLLGRVDDPAGLAGAQRIHRHLEQLTGSDRRTAEDMIELLARRARQRESIKERRMTRKSRDLAASLEAEALIRELQIKRLPVDPTVIAQSLGILVHPKKTRDGVSGMLIRLGNEFGIAHATHIDSEGFKRFCIAHEIGHFRIPGHVDAVLAHGDVHESHAGSARGDRYERDADQFAASLLMPTDLFKKEMETLDNGLRAIEALAERCMVSLLAAANRYVKLAQIPAAVIVNTRDRVDYCIVSEPLRDFEHLYWPRKGDLVPSSSETEEFNSVPANIRSAQRTEAEVDLRLWFGGEREIPATEEVVGLGRYGKTLTVLRSEVFADDEDEEDELEKSWQPRFFR